MSGRHDPGGYGDVVLGRRSSPGWSLIGDKEAALGGAALAQNLSLLIALGLLSAAPSLFARSTPSPGGCKHQVDSLDRCRDFCAAEFKNSSVVDTGRLAGEMRRPNSESAVSDFPSLSFLCSFSVRRPECLNCCSSPQACVGARLRSEALLAKDHLRWMQFRRNFRLLLSRQRAARTEMRATRRSVKDDRKCPGKDHVGIM